MSEAARTPTVDGMSEPDESVVEQNLAYWERLAAHRPGQPAAFFLNEGSALTEDELAAFGDVSGVDIAPSHWPQHGRRLRPPSTVDSRRP